MSNFIPLSVPNLKGRELELTSAAVKSEWVSTGGPYVSEFEKNIAAYVGTDDSVVCQSGTAGLHLALLESGVLRDEIVIVPTLTFYATVEPVIYVGAVPVFMDCDDTLCIDTAKLRRYCEEECELRGGALFEKASGRRVRAVMPVHIFGNLADMESVMDIAAEFGLFVVEDACEALGSRWTCGRYKGLHAGLVGDIGVFSFNGNKIVTTGGGGAIVAQSEDKLKHMRYLSQQAKDDAVRFIHNEVGFNYRMTNLQAALGIAQLEQLDGFIEIKKRNYELYRQLGVDLWPFCDNCSPNYWFYTLVTDNKRDLLLDELTKRGVQSRPIWQLMHLLKPFLGYRAYMTEKSEFFHKNVINLPCSTNLSPDDVRTVARAVGEILA
ncbi:MAG: LegC family aminotransferase [Oscillospiraceae bacterium]